MTKIAMQLRKRKGSTLFFVRMIAPPSGPFRLRLLYDLAVRPRTPTELAFIEEKHLSDVSRGLSKLRKDGLVEYVRIGARERCYKATQEGYTTLYTSPHPSDPVSCPAAGQSASILPEQNLWQMIGD